MKRSVGVCLAVLIVIGLFAIGCGGGGGTTAGGGGGGGGGGGSHGVTLNTYSASLAFGQQLGFTAAVPGQQVQTITWSADGGTITPNSATTATYTAPQTTGTYTVTARSYADGSLYAQAVIAVSSVSVSLSPGTATLAPGGITDFTADAVGTANKNFTFTATAGSITKLSNTTARYVAPSALGSYTVTATLVADSSKKATSRVDVVSAPPQTSIVSGRVVDVGLTTGIGGIAVLFVNSAGSTLKSITTNVDGRFSVQVPISAKAIQIGSASLGSTYYNEFIYNGETYSTLIPTCTAPLPTLVAGQSYNLTDIGLYPTNQQPPPPPTGCH